jgi:hypothetical protein
MAVRDESIAASVSTAVIREALAARGKEAAPAPEPTSMTVPPAGRASAARRYEGPARSTTCRLARWAKTPFGKTHGSSGAADRMASGTPHPERSVFHRSNSC